MASLPFPQTDDDPFATPPPEDLSYDSAYSDDDRKSPSPPPFESRQWKECTPVLEDSEGEAAAELSFARIVAVAGRIEEEDEPDESFATADHSLEFESFESPEACRRRSHSWHEMPAASSSSLTLDVAPPAPQFEDADESDSCSATPSLLDADEFAFDMASPRDSEDSYEGPSTPNTSFPLSSSFAASSAWSPPAREKLSVDPSLSFPTSTPPRNAPHFVEVIETAPTPPGPEQGDLRSRRRSLMTSGLGIDYDGEDDEDEAQSPIAPSSRSQSPLSHLYPGTSNEDLFLQRSEEDLSRQEVVRVVEPSLRSYTSSVYPDAAHFDTYSRRPRVSRAPLQPSEAEDEANTFPFPGVSPADLVSSLLSYPHGANSSTAHLPAAPEEYPSPIPPPPTHVRPIASPSASPDLNFTSYFPTDIPTSTTTATDRRRSAPSPIPFSGLVPCAFPAAAGQPILRAQASNSTLYTYDLAHLPAPRTPRERPYKVRTLSLLLPTCFLGGGKGTGLYGDVCGAIERKAPLSSGAAAASGEQPGAKRRSLSLMSLSGLSRSGSRSSRRRSLFGRSMVSGRSAAGEVIEENPSLEDLETDADPYSRPATSFSRYAAAPAAASQHRIDEFAVFPPPPSGQSTVRQPRRRHHTAPQLGNGRPKSALSGLSTSLPPFAAPAPQPSAPTLKHSTSIRQSLTRWVSGNGRRVASSAAEVVVPPSREEEEEEARRAEERRRARKERRRSSLVMSLFGGSEVDHEPEELDQWVAVMVK
ncbi:hypothetical protein JCM6882_008074 [Rhodosporidiobolus microsporus]